jgi:hypothetical protein
VEEGNMILWKRRSKVFRLDANSQKFGVGSYRECVKFELEQIGVENPGN